MSDKKTAPLGDNASYSNDDVIRMDAKRASRFTSALSRAHRAIHSLEVAANLFPNYGAEPGYMEPITTVRMFAKALDDDIQLLYRMIENDEEPEEDAENA